MLTQLFQRKLALVILLTLAVSCVPQAPLNSVQSTIETLPAVTATPATSPKSTQNVEPAQKPSRGTKVHGGQGQGKGSVSIQNMPFNVPASPFNVILGRPTGSSITLSVLSAIDQTVSIDYGTSLGNYTSHTDPVALQANLPQEITLTDLTPDT